MIRRSDNEVNHLFGLHPRAFSKKTFSNSGSVHLQTLSEADWEKNKEYNIFKEDQVTLFFTLKLVMGFLFDILALTTADNCPGFRHNVTIPQGYVKHVPDAYFTGNLTEIKIWYYIKNIKEVKEERYAA